MSQPAHSYFGSVADATIPPEAYVRQMRDELEVLDRVNGFAPYFPAHGPGRNPYDIALTNAEIDRRRARA